MTVLDIDAVKRIIRQNLLLPPDAPIADDCVMADELKLDSLDAVEMAMAIEEQFGIVIPDPDIKRMKTPALMLEVAQSHMADAA